MRLSRFIRPGCEITAHGDSNPGGLAAHSHALPLSWTSVLTFVLISLVVDGGVCRIRFVYRIFFISFL
jgi:hypothetical protein